ncbi:metal ABC transporter solute-binding protein, Zn/Mn family [Candidatus Tisiphia endosymbiont of Nemotelus uliginosus]|uniref:metal ABC transporter solute-binding protein, Zn/Mn family n=1 Tax=Candidatus Tisiphia endosymbiont of Nemotelus uliginosus TaxID=3077926 RepID=UPI0035C8E761
MKTIISIFILLFHYQGFADQGKIKIVTSITPLAAIIAMLVKEQAELVSIANNSGCPHHYNLKPSDLTKVRNADIIFHINEQFDGFIGKLMNGYSKNVIKISDFPGLNIVKNDSYNNWHIWLDLDNIIVLLEQVAKILVEQFSGTNIYIHNNLEEAKKQIEILRQIKKERLSLLSDVILLTDSVEYFFADQKYPITRLYNSNQKSLKYISNIEQILSTSNSKCLIISSDQNALIYNNLNANTITIESENWQVNKINERLFYQQYFKMINQVAKCLNY